MNEYFIKLPNANYYIKLLADTEQEARRIIVSKMKNRDRLPNGTIVKTSLNPDDIFLPLPQEQ